MIKKVMGDGEKKAPVKSIKIKFQKVSKRKKKKAFGSKGIFSGKRFTRQTPKKPVPPKVTGGTKTGTQPDGDMVKKRKANPMTGKTTGKYSTPQKTTFKRKAKKSDKVDTRRVHTWAKHDKYLAGQQTLKQIKEKNMGTNKTKALSPRGLNRKNDLPHTLRYKRKAKKQSQPIKGVATGVTPSMKRKKSYSESDAGSMVNYGKSLRRNFNPKPTRGMAKPARGIGSGIAKPAYPNTPRGAGAKASDAIMKATGRAPSFNFAKPARKRKSLLMKIKGAGKVGSGKRFKAFKKYLSSR